jgi:hypothetical protein
MSPFGLGMDLLTTFPIYLLAFFSADVKNRTVADVRGLQLFRMVILILYNIKFFV